MPTLAAGSRNSPMSPTNSTIGASLEASGAATLATATTTTRPAAIATAATAATTYTFANNVGGNHEHAHRHHHQQQQQQPPLQQPNHTHHHHYAHPHPHHHQYHPLALSSAHRHPAGAAAASSTQQHYDVASTSTSGPGAVAATSCNGNSSSNLNAGSGNEAFGGNNNSSNGNGNNGAPSSLSSGSNTNSSIGSQIHAAEASGTGNQSEGNVIGGGVVSGGGGSGGAKKSTAPASTTANNISQNLHASREDVASLGGASSINSQNNISNSNNNNNNNNDNTNNGSSSLKESKENLIHGYYNGGGGSITDETEINGEHEAPLYRLPINEHGDDGLGPLPPKWETAYTERGELYFIDHNTGTSHWLDPRLSKFQKKSLEDCMDDELPYGWEKIEDSLYGTYYIDHVNRRTQYENPVLEAKRRAAEQKQDHDHQQPEQTQRRPPSPALQSGASAVPHNAGKLDMTKRLRQQPPPPVVYGGGKPLLPYKFTRNPAEMQGERITATLLKSARGLGITIVGGDEGIDEFLQIKSIVPNGPAWLDGQLQTGDILVYVNDTCVLGFTHHEMVNVFQSIMPGETVTLEVCRGYPLPFDPNDPNTEVVTTIAVDGISAESAKQRRMLMDLNMDGNYNFLDVSGESNGKSHNHGYHATSGGFILMKKPEIHTISIIKGAMGFGFTIADSAYGQKVKKILDRNCCTHLQEGDILLQINEVHVRHKTHIEVVQLLKDCSKTEPTIVKIQRGGSPEGNTVNGVDAIGNVAKLRKNFIGQTLQFRSKTPTADLYSTQQKEILPIRPKTPLVDTRRARVRTPNNELNAEVHANAVTNGNQMDADSKSQGDAKSTNSLQEIEALNQDIPFMDPYPKLVTSLSERLAEVTHLGETVPDGGNSLAHNARGYHGSTLRSNYENQEYVSAASNHSGSYNPIYGLTSMPPTMHTLNPLQHQLQAGPQHMSNMPYHHDSCYCYDCQDYRAQKFRQQQHQHQHQQHQQHQQPHYYSHQTPASNLLQHAQYSPASLHSNTNPLQAAHIQNERMQKRVNELLNDRRKVGFSPLESQHHGYAQQQQQQHSPAVSSNSQQQPIAWSGYNTLQPAASTGLVGLMRNGLDPLEESAEAHYELTEITLERQALGFGFRIVGGTEEGSQVTVGHIVPGGAADNDHRITTGDEILSIDGINVVNSSHHKVVSLMGEAALRGQVNMILRRRKPLLHQQHQQPMRAMAMRFPYDVIVNRHEHEGFGFVIISSTNQYYGSTIGKLIPGSPADRCGELKVGDLIIAVNRIDIAGMSHGDVVNLIKESGLHVRLTIGCPKENSVAGSLSNAANNATTNALFINANQNSPSQISQTQHTPLAQNSPHQMPQQQQQQQQQIHGEATANYFERPNSSINNVMPAKSAQQAPQQQL